MPILWSNFITHNFKNKQKRLSDVGNEQKRQGNKETGESRVLLVSKLSMPRASDGYTGNFIKNVTWDVSFFFHVAWFSATRWFLRVINRIACTRVIFLPALFFWHVFVFDSSFNDHREIRLLCDHLRKPLNFKLKQNKVRVRIGQSPVLQYRRFYKFHLFSGNRFLWYSSRTTWRSKNTTFDRSWQPKEPLTVFFFPFALVIFIKRCSLSSRYQNRNLSNATFCVCRFKQNQM